MQKRWKNTKALKNSVHNIKIFPSLKKNSLCKLFYSFIAWKSWNAGNVSEEGEGSKRGERERWLDCSRESEQKQKKIGAFFHYPRTSRKVCLYLPFLLLEPLLGKRTKSQKALKIFLLRTQQKYYLFVPLPLVLPAFFLWKKIRKNPQWALEKRGLVLKEKKW